MDQLSVIGAGSAGGQRRIHRVGGLGRDFLAKRSLFMAVVAVSVGILS